MAQHKWHKEIKAWADGAEIEIRVNTEKLGCDWTAVKPDPNWTQTEGVEYRIKPQPKEQQYLSVWLNKEDGDVFLDIGLPSGVLEDRYYKYLGKFQLEVNDEAS
jgi:hypothetical protein